MDQKDIIIALSGVCVLGLAHRNRKMKKQLKRLIEAGDVVCECLNEYVQRDFDVLFNDIVKDY